MLKDKPRYLYCEYCDPPKRLIDLCFISKANGTYGNYYCDEICADRDLQQRSERKSRFLWQ